MNQLIEIKEDLPTFQIILNRPEKKNALSLELLDQIMETLEEIRDDKSIRVVVIKGSEDTFCTGADVAAFKEMSAYEAFKFSRKIQNVFQHIEEFPKPVIAAIEGFALGGGLELALACDFRVASTNAKLGSPEINLGIFPGGGGTQRLVKLIGTGKAKELLMLGKVIPAKEAKEIGLVNKIASPEKLEDEVKELAGKLSKKPPIALALLKQIVKYGDNTPPNVGETLESLGFDAVFATKDASQGIQAFLENKETEFKGE